MRDDQETADEQADREARVIGLIEDRAERRATNGADVARRVIAETVRNLVRERDEAVGALASARAVIEKYAKLVREGGAAREWLKENP